MSLSRLLHCFTARGLRLHATVAYMEATYSSSDVSICEYSSAMPYFLVLIQMGAAESAQLCPGMSHMHLFITFHDSRTNQ